MGFLPFNLLVLMGVKLLLCLAVTMVTLSFFLD